MIVTHIKLKNWRNFLSVKADLSDRVFILGPNASGKSNFLDVFRFLRDIAKDGGGLQKAVKDRGGISKIRCLAARRYPNVEIEIHLGETAGSDPDWKYAVGLKQEPRGQRRAQIVYEKVWNREKLILDRPDSDDERDPERKTQTHLEQINSNRDFRPIVKFCETVTYMHLVPQLLRHPEFFVGTQVGSDPFGRDFLERLSKVTEKIRKSWLRRIESALLVAVPQFKQLSFTKDESGKPHLEAIYDHWRLGGARQREDQFSDGTLRLIGLLWSLIEGDSLLLLEEPELSLNSHIVKKLPELLHRVQKKRKRQIMLSTHSADLVSNRGIGPEEILLFESSSEGTKVISANNISEMQALLERGFSPADVIIPRTAPTGIEQLSLF